MESHIITDLAIILGVAALVTIVFRVLNLPVLLGYLVSGFLIGPNLYPESFIKDFTTVHDLGELGVAFLMFYIGLEFDLGKVRRILAPALLGVMLQTLFMLFVGMLTAPILGWSRMDGLFLGCLLAISSTMITIPLLQEQDAVKKNFGQMAIAMLILEDILAILVLVVLTGVGVTGSFQWAQAWQVTFLVGVFVVFVFFLGRLGIAYLIPHLKRWGNAETLTVLAVGLLLGIGELAESFHFSIALGAFLAGSLLAQTSMAYEIEKIIEPLRGLFTAVFFVVVGMRIEPNLLAQYWVVILLLTLLVVFGKLLVVWIGLFLTGQKPKSAFKASASKAQIGEFSFVIAGLGLTYELVNPGIMTLAVGAALGSIIGVSILSKKAEDLYFYLAKKMPKRVYIWGELYTRALGVGRDQMRSSPLFQLVRRPVIQIIFYFLLFNGIFLLAYLTAHTLQENLSPREYLGWAQAGVWVGAALVCLPFLIAIIRNLEVVILLVSESIFGMKAYGFFKQGKLHQIVNTGIVAFVVIVFGGIYLSSAAAFLPKGIALVGFIGLIVVLGSLLWHHMVRVNSRLEQRFLKSFSETVQMTQEDKRKQVLSDLAEKYPWPVVLFDVEVEKDSMAVGKTIRELGVRAQFGSSIVAVTRGTYVAYNPSPDTPLFPGDHVLFIGETQEGDRAKALFKTQEASTEEQQKAALRGKFTIDKVYIPIDAPWVGTTLAESDFRKQFWVTVVGIQRGDKQITNPGPGEIIKGEDVLVVAGKQSAIKAFQAVVNPV